MKLSHLRVQNLTGYFAKSKGLIGENKAKPVLLETRFGIHTFFLKFPIDILILDKHSKVVKLKKNLLPNNVFFWNPKYSLVIELPIGTIDKLNISIGEEITLAWD